MIIGTPIPSWFPGLINFFFKSVPDFVTTHGADIRAVATPLAAVISAIGGAYRLRRQRPNLYFGVQPTYPTTLSKETDKGYDQYWRLRNEYSKKRVHVVDVFLGNRGTVPIKREDFDEGKSMEVDFRTWRDIKYYEVVEMETTPKELHLDISQQISKQSDHVLAIPPLLLNPGDAISLKAVLVGHPLGTRFHKWDPVLNMRIAYISEYSKPPTLVSAGVPPEIRRNFGTRLGYVAGSVFLLAVAYLANQILTAIVGQHVLSGFPATVVSNVLVVILGAISIAAVRIATRPLLDVILSDFRHDFDEFIDERKHRRPQPS